METVMDKIAEKIVEKALNGVEAAGKMAVDHEINAHAKVDDTRAKEKSVYNKTKDFNSSEYKKASEERREAEKECFTCRNTLFDGKEHVGTGMH